MSIFYLIFIAIAAYFSFKYDGTEEYGSHKQHRVWLLCCYMICLTGFSYGLGADKFAYMEEFAEFPTQYSEAGDFIWTKFMFSGQMPLWTLLNMFCKITFDSFYAVQLIESAVVNITVCYLAGKYTRHPFLFLLIYFFSLQYFIFNTEVMREGFSLSLMLIGMDEYMNGRKYIYFCLLPIAILFHVSAAITLLFLFVRFRLTWLKLLYAFLITLSLWLFGDLILGKIILQALGGQEAFSKKILFYAMQTSNIFGFTRSVLTYLILPYIVMYFSWYFEEDENIKKKKEKLTSFMVVLAIMASAFAGAGFIRLYNNIQIFYLLSLTDFIYMLLREHKHFLLRAGTLAGTFVIIVWSYFSHYESTDSYFYEFFYPYTCIIDENADIYFREIAHLEAVGFEKRDDNLRDIE